MADTSAPLTPFDMPEYAVAEAEHATRLNREAAEWSAASAAANHDADDYMLAVVLFASALFFAGMSTKLSYPRQRAALVGLGGLILVGTVIWILTLPISFSA
jgi:hypothetical protein